MGQETAVEVGSQDELAARTCVGQRRKYRAMESEVPTGPEFEQHFSPAELAVTWSLSVTKIRRLFATEPGVMRIGEPSRRLGRKLKRSYFTLRIPASVAERVHRRMCRTPQHSIQ